MKIRNRKMKMMLVGFSCAGMLLVGGCGGGPEKGVVVPEVGSVLLVGERSAIGVDWWKGYGDAALNDLIKKATEQNFDLANLVDQIKIAEEQLGQSRVQGYPKFNASLSSTQNYNLTDSKTVHAQQFDASLQMAWEVDVWGKLASQTKAQMAAVEATRADYQATYLTMINNLSRSYTRLRQFDQQIEIHGRSRKIQVNLNGLYRHELGEGRITADVLNTQLAELLRIDGELSELRRQRVLEVYNIALLVGEGAEELEIPSVGLQDAMELIKFPEVIVGNLLGQRPDILSAELKLKKAGHLQVSAEAARLPQVSFGISGGASLVPTNPASLIASVVPKISFPGLDRSTLTAVNVKKIEVDIAKTNYKKVVGVAIKEVLSAIADYQSYQRQYELESKRFVIALESHGIVRVKFEAGAIKRGEYLKSEFKVLNAEQAVLSNYARLIQANITLHTALGGGWVRP